MLEKEEFYRVCLATLDSYSDNSYIEVTLFGLVTDALRSDVSVVAPISWSLVLAEAFVGLFLSGYRQKLTSYPVFDLRIFKRCLQRTASRVFAKFDAFTMTEFIVNRLRGAETLKWMPWEEPALNTTGPSHIL